MKPTLPVAVVVLNWNGLALSEACLRSWSLADPAPRRLLLVDNGSQDASVTALRRRFPKLEILALPTNLGYAAGNNRGFERLWSKGPAVEAVFICNNDTEIAPDMLGRLWDVLRREKRWAAVGPRILFHADGRIWFEGGRIRALSGRPAHRGYGREAGPPGAAFALPAQGFLTGCGLLVRSALLRQAGGFDETLWAYAEDSDLSLRLASQGWLLGVVPAAVMTHKVSATFGLGSPLAQYFATRNSWLLLRRHRLGYGPLTLAVFAAVSVLRALREVLQGRPRAAAALLRGLRDGWKGDLSKGPDGKPVVAPVPQRRPKKGRTKQ